MPAANLALEDVNKEKNLLPGFTLKLHSNDSEVYTYKLLPKINESRYIYIVDC